MFSSGEQLRSHLKQTAGAGPQPGRGTAGADTSCGVCTTHQPGSREMLVDHIRTCHTVFKEVKYFLYTSNIFLFLLLLSGLQLQAETGDGDLVVFSRWEGNQI